MKDKDLKEVLEELFAGNLFPMQEDYPKQKELRKRIMEQLNEFRKKLPPILDDSFVKLTDDMVCLQSDMEQICFNYGCEFATALLLRSLMGEEAYIIMLEKLKR